MNPKSYASGQAARHTFEARVAKADESLREVYRQIRSTANEGRTCVDVRHITSFEEWRLRNLGYNVNVYVDSSRIRWTI